MKLSFQRKQIGEHVRKFVAGEGALVRRHRRSRGDPVFLQVRLQERAEIPAVVQHLEAVSIFVEPPSVDDGAVIGHDVHGTVDGHHLTRRVEERALDGAGAADGTDVAQVRGDDRPGAADAMTTDAAALAAEDRAPSRKVAGLHRGRVERVHVAEVRDDAGHLGGVQDKRGHAGRRTRSNEAFEIPIDDRVTKRPAAQVDAADRVALRAVAGDAPGCVQRRPVRNVGVGILAVVQRNLSFGRCRRQADPDHPTSNEGPAHGSLP